MQFYSSLSGTEFLLIAFAAFCDAAGAILFAITDALGVGLVLNTLLSFFSTLIIGFTLWYTGSFSWSEAIAMAIFKAAPVLDFLPFYTGYTIRMIRASKNKKG